MDGACAEEETGEAEEAEGQEESKEKPGKMEGEEGRPEMGSPDKEGAGEDEEELEEPLPPPAEARGVFMPDNKPEEPVNVGTGLAAEEEAAEEMAAASAGGKGTVGSWMSGGVPGTEGAVPTEGGGVALRLDARRKVKEVAEETEERSSASKWCRSSSTGSSITEKYET